MNNVSVAISSAIALLSLVLSTAATASDGDWPRFRKGVWQFERTMTLHNNGEGSDGNRVLFKRDMRRCVDPTEAMKETFRPASVGNCHSVRPQREFNKYVFARRCDFMGPVRTTIVVESDNAYTEINELNVGRFPRTDTVIARRIAACD